MKRWPTTAREQISALSYAHLFAGKSHDTAIALAEKIKAAVPRPRLPRLFHVQRLGGQRQPDQAGLVLQQRHRQAAKEEIHLAQARLSRRDPRRRRASPGLPANHASFDLPLPGFLHLTCPHHYRDALPGESEEDFATRLADELEETILREGPDTVAAFIAEPMMGAGGVVLPPRTYFEKMQAVLAKYDVTFIVDEVICGFGRTGEWFGSQTYGLKPDSVSLAKALTSAYAPLGAITVPPHVHDVILSEGRRIGTFAHGLTYGGHPLAAALGLKAIEIYERDDIVGHVQRMAPVFQTRLTALWASIR